MSDTVTVVGFMFEKKGCLWYGTDEYGNTLFASKLIAEGPIVDEELLDALLASEQRANQAEEDVRWLFDYGPGVPNYTSPPDYRKHLDEIRARHPRREDSND